MEFGSKYVYIENADEDKEEVILSTFDDVVISDSDTDKTDDREVCLLDILDTSGQEEYSSLRDQYVHTGDGFVIIYSITDKNSFMEAEAIFKWLKRLKQVDPVAILVANKQDLSRKAAVSTKKGKDLATKLSIPFYETSAKTGNGIAEAVTGLVKIIPRISTDYKQAERHNEMLQWKRRQAPQRHHNYEIESDEEDLFEPLPPSASANVQRKAITVRKTDGNVVLIPLRALRNEPQIVTGDPFKCNNCLAVLTSTAVLKSEGKTKTWKCEFCEHVNMGLDLSDDEVPKGECFDFMLTPNNNNNNNNMLIAPTKSKMKAKKEEKKADFEKKKQGAPGVIVYCMDCSGSMGICCKIPESQAAWIEERTHRSKSVLKVTRLDCIKKAVKRLTEQLKLEDPNKQILLTVFGSDVYVKGGGSTKRLRSFKKLETLTFDDLLALGCALFEDYPLKAIEKSYKSVKHEVGRLSVHGGTALGPALSICLGYVSKLPGSEIVLCTDGEPNIGVGTAHAYINNDFYSRAGDYAHSKNITINILAVGEDSVQLQYVSAAAAKSGGITNRLNPMEIVRQLRLIAQNDVIATSVSVRFYLHQNFVFDEPDYADNLSRLEKEVGTVRNNTDLSFRFKLRNPDSATQLPSVPFQVQITYTRTDGMRCLRVLSKSNPTTKNRKDMEENINVAVLGVATMRTTSAMAQSSKPTEAQHLLKNVKRMIRRGAKSDEQMEEQLAFRTEVKALDDQLTERNDDLRLSHIDDSLYNCIQQAHSTHLSKHAAMRGRSDEINDRKMEPKARKAYYAYKVKF